MPKLLYRLAIVAFSCTLLNGALAVAQPGPSPSPSSSASQRIPLPPVTAYTLPPDKLEKAHALYIIQGWLFLVSTVYGLVILALLLRWGWVAKFRDWSERASSSRFAQAMVVIPLFTIALSVLTLPPSIYQQHVSRQFGLSVQSWSSWFRDGAIQLLLAAIIGTILGWILYAVIRRSARRWWLYFWLAVIPISAFLTFISPEVIDPLFNKFLLLDTAHPEIVTALQAVAKRGGLEIPRERMFEMKASEKLTGSNAYVTGFGATKRVVVWDTAIRKMSPQELQFVFGHELGHYVLGHVVKGFVFTMAFFFVLFYLTYRAANWAQAKWGSGWGIRALDDWASLPLLLIIISIFSFVSGPGLNAYSRYLEHQADIFGLEVVHGLVPDSSQVAAHSFQLLGEEWLDYPYASRLAIFWLWNHPSIPDRIQFSLNYDPWDKGQSPEFVKTPGQ
jgi:STE24 endopeptidase